MYRSRVTQNLNTDWLSPQQQHRWEIAQPGTSKVIFIIQDILYSHLNTILLTWHSVHSNDWYVTYLLSGIKSSIIILASFSICISFRLLPNVIVIEPPSARVTIRINVDCSDFEMTWLYTIRSPLIGSIQVFYDHNNSVIAFKYHQTINVQPHCTYKNMINCIS